MDTQLGYKRFSTSRNGRHASNDITDEIAFGYYHSDGSTDGEIYMRWRDDNATFECPAEALDMLICFPELYEAFGTPRLKLTPEIFCEILEAHDFQDITPTERED